MMRCWCWLVLVTAQRSKREVPQTPSVEYYEPNQEVEFLPRQSRQVEFRSPSRRQNFQNLRWELGYNPSDILNPPELLPAESQYRTMNVYRRQPSSVIDNSPVIWGTPKKGAVVSRPGRSSKDGNLGVTTVYYASKDSKKRQADREEEEDGSEEGEEGEEEEESSEDAGYTEEGHSFHQVPASIYSFFGTDNDGNFNWGRRRPTSPQ